MKIEGLDNRGSNKITNLQKIKRINVKQGISKYKGVSPLTTTNGWQCSFRVNDMGVVKTLHSSHKTEREAAIHYDKCLIKNGEEPINILKRKQK